jgi:hypothetical protein
MEKFLLAAAELGALKALITTGQLKPYLKKSEAFRRYGRKNVEHWISQGLLTPRKDGGHSAGWRIDRLEAAIIDQAKQLLHFL